MSQPQQRLQKFLDQLVADGRERGLQLSVYHKGKQVIDAVAGVTDAGGATKVDGNTLFPIFSCTKGLTATLAHLLVDRGKISYDTPIAEVWPEFAQHGKGKILLRHALSHTSGLQLMSSELKSPADMLDWDLAVGSLARQTPVSGPGEGMVYHAVTFGWIVGEVLRRVDGRPFDQMLMEEISRPLNAPDLYCGLPAELESRVAELDEIFEPGKTFPPADDPTPREVSAFMQPLHQWMNLSEGRRACVPASSGIATARSLARHYAALVPGGVDGVELLPPGRVRSATQRVNPTKPGAEPKGFALGYGLGGNPNGIGSRPTIFGHGGYGGAMGYADPEMQLAVGFTKNLYSSRGASDEVFREVREALGIPH